MQELAASYRSHRVIKARQANHNSYLLPDELEGYEEKALYRYIARWSYIRNEYICCDDVAENFGISVRQATNLISMIHRRYSDVISYKIKRTKSGKGNIIKTHILVTDIKDARRSRAKKHSKFPADTDKNSGLKQLRDTFLYYKRNSLITDGF